MQSSAIQVMKFGGASVKDAASVRNVGQILKRYAGQPLLVVVSAMDKTTNQLEKLAWLARDRKENEAWAQLERIRAFHYDIAGELFPEGLAEAGEKLKGYFEEIERVIRGILLLEEFPPRIYDRIVSYGELISSVILQKHLESLFPGKTEWLDVRALIRTDASYTQAQVIWTMTRENIRTQVQPLFKGKDILITQGFIASSTEGKITTLGREGSDYTASIFANCLDAEKMTVWKDVPGVLSADPRRDSHARKLDLISSEEAVEMTWYGATVIHPKTIKPLFEKNIPMEVRSFLDPDKAGTRISKDVQGHHPADICCTIVRDNQALITLHPRDISFMQPGLLSDIFQTAERVGLQVNLVQTTALSLMLCVNDQEDLREKFTSLLFDQFHMETQCGLSLESWFNFDKKSLRDLRGAKLIQQTGEKLFVLK